MTSLHKRLFIILVTATGIIWASAVAWTYFNSRNQLEHVLDTRLQEAARMVHSLLGNASTGMNTTNAISLAHEHGNYERYLSCQIWSLDGELVGSSTGAPDIKITGNSTGFSDEIVQGELWRVYTIVDPAKGVRILVADRLALRDRLVGDLVKGLVAPIILILPLLGLLIWISLGRGLRPLHELADNVRQKDADDMRPLPAGNIPSEVKPLADALNGLFIKVEAARRHEREVTAFAAHELRTPLAGLKTQAQIALAAADPAIKEGALQQILLSVDRTTRLVRQLLALAKLDSDASPVTPEKVNLGQLVEEIIAQNTVAGRKINNHIDPALFESTLQTDRHSLTLILRNIYENATHYSPAEEAIRWESLNNGSGIVVRDCGNGVAEEEIPLLTTRFYRGSNKSQTGTGLGLTIVETAAKRLGISFALRNRTDRRGMEAELRWA
ncbi:ATP-binding protein [Pseudochrobactrum kiredjianiae]|uniref:histidine kinase n=1 Tax=Pseudochrobactrum kiredjianiae TaxID=386305 RepID=A0ABW3V655_9HYPH|nr:sensor histidine kinase N-terminal domain-containing protein [Pseudochrobactrum kiredjianiae]MDM7850867.1 sensor histidine kinase N-terminal domain-containing protein [Pseudochrobactrum kiredjianiae]